MKKISTLAAAIVALFMFTGCFGPKHEAIGDVEYPSQGLIDSTSYLVGINFGYFLKANGFVDELNEINVAEMKAGILDFIASDGPDDTAAFKIPVDDMNQVFNDYMTKRNAYIAEGNKKAGEDFLSANKEKDGVVVTESGLQYKIIADGDTLKAVDGAKVFVDYTGTTIDGTEFDSGVNAEFQLAPYGLIEGFREGLKLVGEGGEIELYIPADLAYGDRAMGPKIKAGSTLVFKVKVNKVELPAPAAEEVK